MSDVMGQYGAVRERVGLIDRSDAGRLAIVGTDRFTWLQGMVSNDVRKLEAPDFSGRLPACILDATGHLLTDLALVRAADSTERRQERAFGRNDTGLVLLDLPRRNLARIAALLDMFVITEDVEIIDVSDRLTCFSVQGPDAAARLADLDDASDEESNAAPLIVPADHTGSGGFDIYLSASQRQAWEAEGRFAGMVRIEAEAQEILRVEAGIPVYGPDMDETVIALEANLGPSHISLIKGCYVGQEIIARIDSRGHTNRALTGLVFAASDVPKPGDILRSMPTVEELEGKETGRITSVIASAPAAGGRPIALGYVRHEHRTPGARVRVGESAMTGTVHALPFYTRPA